MNNFLDYRRDKISPQHKNDNAQLITGHVFTDGVVGKAVKSTICSWQYSGGVDMDHSKVVGPVATTVAHEMGHNFGMQHDDHTCDCPDDRCIMAASSGGKNPIKWSSCSRDNLADAFHQGLDYCLLDLPEDLYGSPMCGNGFVEDGEQCDCGLPEDCTTPCCNATTCKMMQNATCATGACCDTNTCQVKPATTSCRSSRGECDLAEYCDGSREYCPSDIYLQNGQTCLNDKGYCYHGKCSTHDGQCSKLWGPTGKSSHSLCYQHFNTFGEANGNCGFNWLDKGFKKCAPEDIMCGMLHCTHRNERLVFWKEALSYLMPEAWVMVNGTQQNCKGAILDVGLNMPDPGMTPEGAKCATGKVCIGQKCERLDSLDIPQCPYCNELGVCNSLGQCHCQAGYKPPFCDKPGDGGSLHSGPIKLLQPNTTLVIAMVILFLLIIPMLGVAAFLSYRYRQKLKKLWNGRPYKYDFLHRAKRSEPPRDAPITVQRPAPPPPQDRSKRQSFRDQAISSPKLESTTKNAQSLENMTDIGYRVRALPARPDERVMSPPGGRPTSPLPNGTISPPSSVPNGYPSYHVPPVPAYPVSRPSYPPIAAPQYPSTHQRYTQDITTSASQPPPERPPPTYMDVVGGPRRENSTPDDARPPSPPPPLLKPRLSMMEHSKAAPYSQYTDDDGYYNHNDAASHRYENVSKDSSQSNHVANSYGAPRRHSPAKGHHNSPTRGHNNSPTRGHHNSPTRGHNNSPTREGHFTTQGLDDSQQTPSSRVNDFKNKFENKGANNDVALRSKPWHGDTAPSSEGRHPGGGHRNRSPGRHGDFSRSNPVRRSNTTANSTPSSGDNKTRNPAARTHTTAGGRNPTVNNRTGKPAVGKKPEISSKPKSAFTAANNRRFRTREGESGANDIDNSEC
jgi:hypothetical protein